LFPERLASQGKRIYISDYFHNHPINPTTQWDQGEAINLPGTIPFTNSSFCSDQPMTFVFTLYHGFALFSPLKRNPT
jgi:hypothetical protein